MRRLGHDHQIVAVFGEPVDEPGDDGLAGLVLHGRLDLRDEPLTPACRINTGLDTTPGGLLHDPVGERDRVRCHQRAGEPVQHLPKPLQDTAAKAPEAFDDAACGLLGDALVGAVAAPVRLAEGRWDGRCGTPVGVVEGAARVGLDLRRAALECGAGRWRGQGRSDVEGDGGEDRGFGVGVDLGDGDGETGGEGR
jgi:hypothetical protein